MSSKQIILLHAHFDEAHLAKVINEMKVLGAPTLRGIEQDSAYYLVEGCHRARAAKALGLPITVEPIELECDDYGVDGRTLNDVLGTDEYDVDATVDDVTKPDWRLNDRHLDDVEVTQ